jgi:amino acid transporter/nucleotide-binding universal stress UspA family protein
MSPSTGHRPRNLDWKRAAALLYGDWGTSKAYVIGLAFVAAGYASLPIIVSVSALTALVAFNYVIICKHFPDGGGVYSAARDQSRLLAVIGALLLVADLTVTASLSGWSAITYFKAPKEWVWVATIGLILCIGVLNFFGPRHSGSVAVSLAVPTVVVVVLILIWAAPHLTLTHLEPSHQGFSKNWTAFVGVILALSGVEAIANLTGVMKLDDGASNDAPRVGRTATKAIWPVAIEVVLGTALLGWAMLSLPESFAPQIRERYEDMLSYLAEQYGTMAHGAVFGKYFGIAVGAIVGLLLLSAVNTAVAALIGLMYLLARDGEMPPTFTRLNRHGVPWIPLGIAVALPIVVVLFANDLQSLADLYAIGVVGAIAVNLGSCVTNKELKLKWWERSIMALTFLILFAVELSIAKTKPNALFFGVCVLGLGLGLRGYVQRRAGLRTLTVSQEVATAFISKTAAPFHWDLTPGLPIMVAARGLTSVLKYALEEARLRESPLFVVYIKPLAVALPGPLSESERPRWQADRQAAQIMYSMLEMGREQGVSIVPVYAVSEDPAATILDFAATLGIEILMLGSPNRHSLLNFFKGDVVTQVVNHLPPNIQLIIHG